MKSAGPGGVTEITEILRFTQYLRPWHFSQLVLERHWMGDQLQTFIQTAIRLNVQIFGIPISDFQ